MKTYLPNKNELSAKARWYLIDAADIALGKVATLAARLLTGKHRADFTPHIDLGDGVIIVNAEKVRLTGKKSTDKLYRTHSGYLGNLKEVPAGRMLEKQPKKVLELAVMGMLPKNKLKDGRLTRLKLYVGTEHKQTAQQPVAIQP